MIEITEAQARSSARPAAFFERWAGDVHVAVTMIGPLSRLWARILGGGFRTSTQPDLDRLVALCEGRPA